MTPLFIFLIAFTILLIGFIFGRLSFKFYIQVSIKQLLTSLKEDNSEYRTSTIVYKIKEIIRNNLFLKKQVSVLDEHRKYYTGNVAHELKTPLMSIQGYLQLVLDDPTDIVNNEQYTQKALRNANRLNLILNDLDLINKNDNLLLKLNPTYFNLDDLVIETFETLLIQANTKEINLFMDKKNAKVFQVFADKDKISQVLTNLVSNSIKYGKQNGVTEVILTDLGNTVLTQVKDNGTGINNVDLPRIFERFFRSDSSRDRQTGGSGLGLAICKNIIEAHKQRISVISTPNTGTLFSFPLEKANS